MHSPWRLEPITHCCWAAKNAVIVCCWLMIVGFVFAFNPWVPTCTMVWQYLRHWGLFFLVSLLLFDATVFLQSWNRHCIEHCWLFSWVTWFSRAWSSISFRFKRARPELLSNHQCKSGYPWVTVWCPNVRSICWKICSIGFLVVYLSCSRSCNWDSQ